MPPSAPTNPAHDVDDSEFPLVIVRVRRACTDEEFERYLSALDGIYARHRRFALVMDITEGAGATAAQRRRQAEWMRQQAMLISTFNLGTAFVVPGAVARGALTAILWLQPMPSPHFVCETPPEAVRWCRSKLAAVGELEPPAG